MSDLEKVKQDGHNLQFVENQTPEICLAAVKKTGYALQFVKKQTTELCLEAVKQNGWALEFVKNQTEEICLEAVRQDRDILEHLDYDLFEKVFSASIKPKIKIDNFEKCSRFEIMDLE